MNRLSELFLDNPMFLEAKRLMRRFVGFRSGPTHAVIFALVIVGYIGLMGLLASTSDVPPIAVIICQTVAYCIVLPPVMQGCIAGEREKGTWESLLVAPVTKAQIVVGKYWGAVLVVAAITALMVPPLFWTYSGGVRWDPTRYSSSGPTVTAGRLVAMEAVSVTFGLMLAAWCVLVSARSRRSLAAQGMIYGSMILALVAWPVFIDMLWSRMRELNAVLNSLHPFVVLFALNETHFDESDSMTQIATTGNGMVAAFAYVAMAITFLVWADRTLRFAESDVRFLPRRRSAPN